MLKNMLNKINKKMDEPWTTRKYFKLIGKCWLMSIGIWLAYVAYIMGWFGKLKEMIDEFIEEHFHRNKKNNNEEN